jgi:hypothetical protein
VAPAIPLPKWSGRPPFYLSLYICFNCKKSRHSADKFPEPSKKIKQEINALNIDDNEKENICRIFQNNDFKRIILRNNNIYFGVPFGRNNFIYIVFFYYYL